jgi:pantoate--beta-alanine ligase
MSSRNAYLSVQERARALALFRGLQAARSLFAEGVAESSRLTSAVQESLRAEDVREDYVALVDAETLLPLPRATVTSRLLVAGFVGATRLIDNVAVG